MFIVCMYSFFKNGSSFYFPMIQPPISLAQAKRGPPWMSCHVSKGRHWGVVFINKEGTTTACRICKLWAAADTPKAWGIIKSVSKQRAPGHCCCGTVLNRHTVWRVAAVVVTARHLSGQERHVCTGVPCQPHPRPPVSPLHGGSASVHGTPAHTSQFQLENLCHLFQDQFLTQLCQYVTTASPDPPGNETFYNYPQQKGCLILTQPHCPQPPSALRDQGAPQNTAVIFVILYIKR